MSRRRIARLVALSSALASCTPTVAAPPRPPLAAPVAPAPSADVDAPPPIRPPTPDAPFRASAPPLRSGAPAALPLIHSFHLKNGIPVLFIERHTPGLLRVEVTLKAQPAPAGANETAARARWLGTSKLPQAQLQAALDADMAQLASWHRWGRLVAAMTMPSSRAASAIPRLADVILEPAFPAAELVRFTRELAHDAVPVDDAPRTIASRVLPAALYGGSWVNDDSPPRSADLGALRRDDIVRAYEAALDPASASIVAVGDTTEAPLRSMLEASFGGWHGHAKHAPAKGAAPTFAASSPHVVLVDHPGPVALVVFGGESAPFADIAPMRVVRALLSGPKGRSVPRGSDPDPAAIGVNLATIPGAPRVEVSQTVPTARAAEALASIDRRLRAMKTDAIAPEALEGARERCDAEVQAPNATLEWESEILRGVVFHAAPPDDVSKRTARLDAVTADDVRRAAERYLDPDRMKVVVIGDLAKMQASIAALGWGPVEIRDASGAVVPAKGAP